MRENVSPSMMNFLGKNNESAFGHEYQEAQFSDTFNDFETALIRNVSAASDTVFGKVSERLRSCAMRIKTGIDFFDEMSGGGIYNGLNILSGMPNVGKTTFLIQLATELSAAGQPVVFMSKDMSMTEIVLKALSYISGVYLNRELDVNNVAEAIRNDTLPNDLRETFEDICKNLHIRELRVGADTVFETVADALIKKDDTLTEETESDCIDDTSKSTDVAMGCLGLMSDIFEIYSKAYVKKPVFIIDSLQSVSLDTGKAGKDGVDITLTYIKYWQMQCNSPVIVVSNLNRASYDRGDITISSLKESGNIEYDASSVWCIAAMDLLKNCREDTIRYLRFINLKDRAAGGCEVEVNFNVHLGRFYTDDDLPPVATTPFEGYKGFGL